MLSAYKCFDCGQLHTNSQNREDGRCRSCGNKILPVNILPEEYCENFGHAGTEEAMLGTESEDGTQQFLLRCQRCGLERSERRKVQCR
ncbi:hypothetical protein KJ937_01940 [Patescibacteria group bacterium]|nr:hypothetical protein [Patescibacteria group bacterium]